MEDPIPHKPEEFPAKLSLKKNSLEKGHPEQYTPSQTGGNVKKQSLTKGHSSQDKVVDHPAKLSINNHNVESPPGGDYISEVIPVPNEWESNEGEEEEAGEGEEDEPLPRPTQSNILEEYENPVAGEFEQEEEGETEDLPLLVEQEPPPNYKLNDFVRAKEFFMTSSTKTGISLYDHFSELIRKLLDSRAPTNPVDFVEELSLNLKRYRFGMVKDVLQDSSHVSPSLIQDARYLTDTWKKHAMWSLNRKDTPPEGGFGGFPNLLRLQYYLEQINIGLPREEMFRVALLLRQLRVTRPIARIRFWGKIFCTEKNYYVVEVEMSEETEQDAWVLPIDTVVPSRRNFDFEEDEEEMEDSSRSVPGAGDTFRKAGGVVTNTEILSAYHQTSGLAGGVPPNSARGNPSEILGEHLYDFTDPDEAKEVARWQEYQLELMSSFPVARIEDKIEIPPEAPGTGINSRIFYVCNDLTEDWVRLPSVTPQQINISRQIRWFLTGQLNAKVRSVPVFPGREGHYLRALLARITAGTQVSPKGYYQTKKYGDEEEGEDEEEEEEEEGEEEEEEEPKTDIVYPKKHFRPTAVGELANSNVDLWVHHVSHILRQGRNIWINLKPKKKKDEDEEEEEEEVEEEEEEEEEEGEHKEVGPPLFTSLAEDKSLDTNPSIAPWTARASSSVFAEFQVAQVRSNLWPGANAMCTVKGKVENIYLGDGLKFYGHSYAPPIPEETQQEYKEGPELKEITDPSVLDEQAWLAKLQLNEIADIEEKFVDNETDEEGGEEEEDEDDD